MTNALEDSLSIKSMTLQKKRLLSKLANADEEQGVDSAQKVSVYKALEASSTGVTKRFATVVELRKQSRAFTLFEVLIALAVFALAITGLAMALQSIVQTALEARQRAFCRLELESRLAYNMVDPPLSGDRTFEAKENHGFHIVESATPENLQDGEGNPITGIYRLKITSKSGNITDAVETLIYHPN